MNNIPVRYSEETYSKVLNFLSEAGYQCGNFSYKDALVHLKSYMGIKKPENAFRMMFGQYAIVAEGYWLLDKNELETARKYLKKIRGSKLYVRIMPDVRFWQKEFHGFAEAGMILWEMSGVSREVAMQAVCELQQLLGIPLGILGM